MNPEEEGFNPLDLTPEKLIKMIMGGQGKVIEMEHKCDNALCPGYQEKPLFEMGEIKVSPEVSAQVKKDSALGDFVNQILRRHHMGDGGDLSPDDKVTHFRQIMKEKDVASRYRKGKRVIHVVTREDRTHTFVLYTHEFIKLIAEGLTNKRHEQQ